MNYKFVLCAAFLLATATGAKANIPNNYAFYDSEAWDFTTGHLLVSVQVTGSTVPPVPPMGGAYHYAKIYAAANGKEGSWQQGPMYCTSCNMNWTSSPFDLNTPVDCIPLLDEGLPCDITLTEDVNCTVAGTFVTVAPGLKIVVSTFGLQFQDASGCHYFPTCTGTCTLNGRFSSPAGWPGNVCPPYLFCADIYAFGLCVLGLCKAETFDIHLCS